MLADFVSFGEAQGDDTTTKLAVAWATLPCDRHASCALRLADVRGFVQYREHRSRDGGATGRHLATT